MITRLAILTVLISGAAYAGDAVVVDAKARNTGSTWSFDVTLKHADTGWDHYANGWGVYLADGTELGYRILAHPHINEQPFTRSLSGVKIPDDVSGVIIKPRDLVHGVGPEFTIQLRP